MELHDRDSQLAAHRAQFMAALPRRLEALHQGVANLRQRPESETNRSALRRRLEALHEAALALDLAPPASAFGQALIAIAGPDIEPDDLDLLADAMAAVTALIPDAVASEPAELHPSDASASPDAKAVPAEASAAEADASPSEPEPVAGIEPGVDPTEYSPEPATLQLVVDPASGRRFCRGPEPIDVSGRGIEGRTVLIADDDSSVLWHLSSAISAAGGTVIEARDGLEAWEACLREAPDLVLCDVMMPKLDGFALCRNLKRDVALSDVPVILLSWKEDLLQRARELGADANGYLPKDSDEQTVVALATEALAPRTQLEARIEAGGVVHGRLDGVTPRYVLEVVARSRRDQIVEFCDAGFAYEAHFRGGLLIAAQRRGEGGTQQGERILSGLLGMRAGRFILRAGETLPPHFDGALERVLEPHVRHIRAACRVVRGAELHRVRRLELDERVLGPYRGASPPVAKDLIDKLAQGVAPTRLQHSVSAALLEEVLIDLAIRGAIRAARDERDADLLEQARPAPVDAAVGTPLPPTVSAAAVASLGGKSAPESQVVFSERLEQSHRLDPHFADSEPPPPEPAPAPEPVDAVPVAAAQRASESGLLRARIAELFPSRGEQAAVDLSQAVFAGLSLTPRAPARAAVTSTTKPVAAPRKSARETSVDPVAAPRKASGEASGKPMEHTPAIGEAGLDAPAPGSRARLRGSSRQVLVSALSVLAKGWDIARDQASEWAHRTSAWSPSDEELGAALSGSPPPPESDAPPSPSATVTDPPSPAASNAASASRSDETAPAATRTSEAPGEVPVRDPRPKLTLDPDPVALVGSAGADHESRAESAKHLEVDTDATDPNWLPPVDTDFSGAIPLRRPLPDLSWVGRVALPVLLVSIGGYAAFSVVGAISRRVPQVAATATTAPSAAESPAVIAAAPVSTADKSAAQLLLDRAKARSGDATDTPSEKDEPDGDSPELDAQITELPKGVTLAGDKGLLEINSGDRHKIYVAGVFVGRGPARRVPLAPGQHEVRTRLGGVDRSYQVVVEAGKRTRLEPVRATAGR